MMRKNHILITALFIVYIVFLIWAIIFKFSFSFADIPFKRRYLNLIPFGSLPFFYSYAILRERILNLIIFLPFGGYLFMGKLKTWTSVLVMCAISFLFEALQYAFSLGTSDVTDIIMNTLGGTAGYLLTFLFSKITMNDEKTEILFLLLAGAVTTGVIVFVITMKINGLTIL